MLRKGLFVTSILLASLLVVCTTVTHLKSPFSNSDVVSTINPATILDITIKNGNEHRITVSSVNGEEIKGEKLGERFEFEDIEKIKIIEATVIGKVIVYTTLITLNYLFWDFIVDAIIGW